MPWRRVVLPPEHGGWSFLAEPIALGLAVEPSMSGGLIALSAMAAFLARQPLKQAVADRRHGRRYTRTGQAERALAVLALGSASALAGGVLLARGPALVAIGLAAPLATAALAFDLARRGRALAAEMMAPLALGAVAAAIALAGGWAPAPALGLWGIMAARGAPTVLYVRARLRLDRGEPAALVGVISAHVAAVAAVAWLVAGGVAPGLAIAGSAILCVRAVHGLSPWRPRLRPAWLGVTETVFGAINVIATAVGAAL